MPDDELLSVDFFASRVGEVFEIAVEGREPYRLEVLEAREVKADSDSRQPFSVLFRGADDLLLPQRIYRLAHADLEPLDLFLVPLGPTREHADAVVYEATFG